MFKLIKSIIIQNRKQIIFRPFSLKIVLVLKLSIFEFLGNTSFSFSSISSLNSSTMALAKDTTKFLMQLRALMADTQIVTQPLAAYIIPSEDAHHVSSFELL